MHLLMQYLDLNGPDPEEQAASLTARHLLTPEQAASLDLEQVRRFLASPLAQRIRRAEQVYREYRFSLLLPAALYDPAAEPEDELMLQGVVDCAFRTRAWSSWTSKPTASGRRRPPPGRSCTAPS